MSRQWIGWGSREGGRRRMLTVCLAAWVIRIFGFALLFPADGWHSEGYGSEMGQIAANLTQGNGYSSPFAPGSNPTAWLAPLVPLIWSAVFHVAGVFSWKSLLVIGMLQCAASAAACCFYVLSMRRLLDSSERGMGVVWGTAEDRRLQGESGREAISGGLVFTGTVLWILWPPCIRAAREFWYFSWQECAVAALFWASLEWAMRPAWRRAGLMGLCAGVVALINPVPLVLLPGALLFSIGKGGASCLRERSGECGEPRPHESGFRKAALLQWTGALVVAGALLTPWLVRNAGVFHALIPVRSSFGVEFLQGNNPDGAIVQARSSLHPALSRNEFLRFQKLGEPAYNREAMERALAYIRRHPGVTLKRMVQRAYVFWLSDLRGDWPWQDAPVRPPGWSVRRGVRALPWVGLTCALVWLVGSGRYRSLPGRPLFTCLFVFIPLPYLVTHVSPMYAYLLHPYIIMAGLCLFPGRTQDNTGDPP